ncbi:MAG: 4-(cytidine 5'-diphospho)-2-C-methyl-D-erythritol kinase [Clostridia bacterium]
MLLKAHAKINLTLDITGKRNDGYHDLDTVMQSISLYDTVDLTKNRQGTIHLTCNKITLPLDKHNTAYKAAQLIFEHCGQTDIGVNIHINKNIPSQAGMGGGSSDAAAVINGMNKLFGFELSQNEMVEIAAKVGADVPFCLSCSTSRCLGIGDIIENLPAMPFCHILVCKPPVGVDTGFAYKLCDKYPQDDYFMTPSMVNAIKANNLEQIAENIGNRFDDILQLPEVQIIKSIMDDCGALNASMTGSGSSVFGIFTDEETMKYCGNRLSELGEIFYCKPENHEIEYE